MKIFCGMKSFFCSAPQLEANTAYPIRRMSMPD